MRRSRFAIALVCLFPLIPRLTLADEAPPAAAPAGSASSPTTATSSTTPNRLDFSVPDVPAFTALGVSPSMISQPTNVKDLVTAIASGVSADGHLQAGLAIEASPAKIIDNAIHGGADTSKTLQNYVGGLRLSFATNSKVVGADTQNQAAIGVRWSLSDYTPETDRALNQCISVLIPLPTIETILTSATPGVPASPIAGGGGATGQSSQGAGSPASSPPIVPPASGSGAAAQLATTAQCRTEAQAAHLAQSGIEVAYVDVEQALDSTALSSYAAQGQTAWLAASLGFNTFKFIPEAPATETTRSERAKYWTRNLTGNGDPSNAIGLQLTGFVRYDSTRLSDSGWQSDVFLAARVSVRALAWSLFGEGGYRFVNVTNHSAPPATNTNGAPLGIGGDVRLSDGTWFGLYAGYDAITGQVISVGNIKWSIGQNRPY